MLVPERADPSRAGTSPVQEEEVALEGGRLTGGVVRVGQTVRRPVKPSSPFVARLLSRLEEKGFQGAPRYLGPDERGRDTFSYIPGSVPPKFRRFEDAQLRAVGALLRGLHDATRGCELAGELAVVCHHDPGPNNFVFHDELPVALIDFDMAAPGDPLEDLGYAAWLWCVSSKPERGPVGVQAAQVRLLADAYGLDGAGRSGLVDAMVERQTRNVGFWKERMDGPGEDGVPTSLEQIEARIEWSLRERDFTEAHRAEFAAMLR